jgi:hypothetical protein
MNETGRFYVKFECYVNFFQHFQSFPPKAALRCRSGLVDNALLSPES